MAVIHRTTMNPTKLELIAAWLPQQPWYVGSLSAPELTKAGGFRLDDPEGEVGIEFMAVTDTSGDRPLTYHVPLTYRAAPLDGAERWLVGTSEHGVLGLRWVYDGTHDPVLVAQLPALLQGRAEPQAQNVADTPDPSVAHSFSGTRAELVVESSSVADGPHATDLLVRTRGCPVDQPGRIGETSPGAEDGRTDGATGASLTLRVTRVLHADAPSPGTAADDGALGAVVAGWRLPTGEECRGRFIVARAER
ncbi:1,4-alpha-glucan branching protein [Streptomyces sp. NPDC006551]|uniref:maltokinase N-terminal cap-like domain-containing protein n=1 Tax=Streptomyces sp. NPDC006551 TaxID=3157178 RepID=UPI0033BF01CF